MSVITRNLVSAKLREKTSCVIPGSPSTLLEITFD